MSSKRNSSKRYTPECKRDAVELVRSSRRTVTEVARDLGVSAESLRAWVKQAKVDQGEGPADSLTTAEKEARALRLALRLSVRGFADHLGVAVRTVSKWEKLLTDTEPRPDTQAILDTALGRADAAVHLRFETLLSGPSAVLRPSGLRWKIRKMDACPWLGPVVNL